MALRVGGFQGQVISVVAHLLRLLYEQQEPQLFRHVVVAVVAVIAGVTAIAGVPRARAVGVLPMHPGRLSGRALLEHFDGQVQPLCARRATRGRLEHEDIVGQHQGKLFEVVFSDQEEGAFLALDTELDQRGYESVVDDVLADIMHNIASKTTKTPSFPSG
jgi:hypothetical protein